MSENIESDYKEDLLLSLNDVINACLIKYETIDEAYIYLLDYKDVVINKAYSNFMTIPLINNGVVVKSQKYKDFKSEHMLKMELSNIYLKTINDRLKIYKCKKKVQKEFVANKTYEIINDAIIQSKKSGVSIVEIIDTVKSSDFKNLCLQDLQNEIDFDINLFNQVYTPTINKIIAFYKYDYDLEKKKRKEEKKKEESLKKDPIIIPLEWKLYGIAKGFNLFTRHAKKNRF